MEPPDIDALAADAAAALLQVRKVGGAVEMILPVLHANGARVVVTIRTSGGGLRISDEGDTAEAAALAGIDEAEFAAAAGELAARVGAIFDEGRLEIEAPPERLAGAVMVVADLARQCLEAAWRGRERRPDQGAGISTATPSPVRLR